jgi:Peptidase family M28
MRTFFIITFIISFSYISFSQSSFEKGLNTLNKDILQAELTFLSSDYLEGRELGKKGGYIAAEYIASLMKIYGLKPLYKSYFQEFNLVQLNQDGKNSFNVVQNSKSGSKTFEFQDGVDFKIALKDLSRKLEASIAFAGYGITDENLGYDDYKGIDVNGKIVIILDGFPGHHHHKSTAFDKFFEKYTIRRYAKNYSKIENAMNHGAIGIIKLASDEEVSTWNTNKHYFDEEDLQHGLEPNKSFWDKEYILHNETIDKELLEVYVTKRLANFIINDSNFDFIEYENYVENQMKPKSFHILQNKVEISTLINTELVKCRNVCGILKGKDTTQNIIVGAHYDHYGMYNNYIWNGADDNGSGTAGMLALANAFCKMGEKPEHNIIFLSFDAEEKGLYGSTYFASQMKKDCKINYMMNFDMISRNSREDNDGNLCYIIYDQAQNNIRTNFEQQIQDHNLNLSLTFYPSTGKTGGSDHSPFAKKDIPFSFFWSGWHDDYHNPSDEIEKINWDKMLNLCKLGFIHIYEIDKNGLN